MGDREIGGAAAIITVVMMMVLLLILTVGIGIYAAFAVMCWRHYQEWDDPRPFLTLLCGTVATPVVGVLVGMASSEAGLIAATVAGVATVASTSWLLWMDDGGANLLPDDGPIAGLFDYFDD